MKKLWIGWFSTGRDKAARDLLAVVKNSIEKGELKAEISFVFSNREPGETEESDLFFKLVRGYHIPLICFSSKRFESPGGHKYLSPQWRLEYDREVMRRLEGSLPNLCVLAGYMLIVGPEMCQKYPMINLHPAAPGGPTGTWQEVIWKLMGTGATETGLMMHLVTPELDKGPPVTFATFPIRGGAFAPYWREIIGYSLEEIKEEWGEDNSLFKTIRAHGLAREFPLIVATLKAFSQGKVRIERDKIVDVKGEAISGYELTSEIDAAVKNQIRKEE